MQSLKCVVVGDGCVGKSYMIEHFITGLCPQQYYESPSTCPRVKNIEHNGETIRLLLCDTPGQEDFSKMRTLFYPDTSVFIVCFSLVSRSSFNNATKVWIPEVRQFLPNAPIVIVGMKMDLRSDEETIRNLKESNETVITHKEGNELKNKLKAAAYVECSATKYEGVKEVFGTAVQVAIKGAVESEESSGCCCIS